MSRIAALAAAAFVLTAAPAAADDYAATARNIIPSGQYGGVPPPRRRRRPGADVRRADAAVRPGHRPPTSRPSSSPRTSDSARTGRGRCPGAVPRPGVTIVRDRFNVPHITGQTRDDVTWAMGWLLAEDRGLLLAQARDAARLAAIDAPNINAFGLVINLKQYTPTREVDRIIQRDGDAALRSAGAAGRAVRHDIDVYLQGLNARWAVTGRGPASTSTPRTRSPARSSARAAAARHAARSSTTGCATGSAARAGRRSSTTCRSSTIPTPRRRSAARSATGARTARARATSCSTRAPSSRPGRAGSLVPPAPTRAGRATS